MVRVLLTAAVISFVVGVFPAYADCTEWCRVNRCGVGGLSGRNANCMPRCVETCQAKHKHSRDIHRNPPRLVFAEQLRR
jgi:hypothetical protein